MSDKHALEDGIYVVHNGRLLAVDGFEFGYEGIARWQDAGTRVIEENGRLVLAAGPRDKETLKVASHDGEFRRLIPLAPQPPESARKYIVAADNSGQVKFFSTIAAGAAAMAVTGWIPCPWGSVGAYLPKGTLGHNGRSRLMSVGISKDTDGSWCWDLVLKGLW